MDETKVRDWIARLRQQAVDAVEDRGTLGRSDIDVDLCNEVADGLEAIAPDIFRYRWLRETFNAAKGGASLTVNEELGVYEKPEPGKEVRIQWYPNTPVGFNLVEAATLDEAIDDARSSA